MRNLEYSYTTDVIQYASWSVLLQRMLSEGGLHARGIEMIKKRKAPTGSKGGGAPSAHAEQGNLWLEPHVHHLHARTPASSTPQPAIATLTKPQSQQSAEIKNCQRTLQDLLFTEGLLAARLAVNLDSLEVQFYIAN